MHACMNTPNSFPTVAMLHIGGSGSSDGMPATSTACDILPAGMIGLAACACGIISHAVVDGPKQAQKQQTPATCNIHPGPCRGCSIRLGTIATTCGTWQKCVAPCAWRAAWLHTYGLGCPTVDGAQSRNRASCYFQIGNRIYATQLAVHHFALCCQH